MSNNVLCYDRITGTYFYATMARLQECQDEINSILKKNEFISYDQYIDIMTEDWPYEVRKRFFENRGNWGSTHGVARKVGELEFGLNKSRTITKDGLDIIMLHFDADKEP